MVERFGRPAGPDVLLSVGNGANQFVCVLAQSILRQLGPRWESLLSASAKHAKKILHGKRMKTVNLRDENPNAIRLILLIATHQDQKLPKMLDFTEIVHPAWTAELYGAKSLLAGYVDGWLTPY